MVSTRRPRTSACRLRTRSSTRDPLRAQSRCRDRYGHRSWRTPQRRRRGRPASHTRPLARTAAGALERRGFGGRRTRSALLLVGELARKARGTSPPSSADRLLANSAQSRSNSARGCGRRPGVGRTTLPVLHPPASRGVAQSGSARALGARRRGFKSRLPDKSLRFTGKNSANAKDGGFVASQLPGEGPGNRSGRYLPSLSMAARRCAVAACAYRCVISSFECPARTRTASAPAPLFISSEMK